MARPAEHEAAAMPDIDPRDLMRRAQLEAAGLPPDLTDEEVARLNEPASTDAPTSPEGPRDEFRRVAEDAISRIKAGLEFILQNHPYARLKERVRPLLLEVERASSALAAGVAGQEPVALPTQAEMNQAFYVDVCRAEDRLKEFIIASRALLDSLPPHWHGDKESELRDLADETEAVLAPHLRTPHEVEQATKRYGAAAVVPRASPLPAHAAAKGVQEVVVKPLRWEAPDGEDGNAWLGHGTDMCQFYLRREGGSWWLPGDSDDAEEFANLEAAKAAAQTDYEQRIRSALATPPPLPAVEPEAALIREAATDLLADLDRLLRFSDTRIVEGTNASVKRLRFALSRAAAQATKAQTGETP